MERHLHLLLKTKNMKTPAFIFTACLFSGLSMNSQITVDSFERQPRVNIDKLDQFAPITAKSSCGEVQVEMNEQMFSGGCLGNLVRTYVFTDDCGNKEQAEQYLVLQDDKAPVFLDVPEDLVAHANAIPEKTEMKVEDNSEGKIELDFSEKIEDHQILRTWVAIDQCGNQSIASQVITIQDPKVSLKK
ncbi:MAG: hypothetical protein ACI9RU_000107 [Litorivivens sp.]|jgi:hypothetical protein